MDEECKHRDNIVLGSTVMIAPHRNLSEDNWIEGIVKEIVDKNNFNEDGILVKIENNIIGHTKKIIQGVQLDEELSETQILQMLEDVKRQRGFETRTFDLKETFWYDVRASERANRPIKNLKLEYVVVNEVCGFLNTVGGHVIIGVTNDGDLKGITEERDLQWMEKGKKDLDHFADMIMGKLHGKYFKDDVTINLVRVKPQVVQGFPLIVIYVTKSRKPFFVHKKGTFKDENGFESHIDYLECIIRKETGIEKIPFDSFMEIWDDREN